MQKLIISLIVSISFILSQNSDKVVNTCGKISSQFEWLSFESTLTEEQEKIDIVYYDIDLNIDLDSEQIFGNVLIRGKTGFNQPDSIELDFSNSMVIDSILLNNDFSVFNHRNNKIKIPKPQATYNNVLQSLEYL